MLKLIITEDKHVRVGVAWDYWVKTKNTGCGLKDGT